MLSHRGDGEGDGEGTGGKDGRGGSAKDVRERGRLGFWMCVLPVNEIKVFLQVSWVNVGFAELQLSPRVVVNVVDAHFICDAETALRRHVKGR